jgi:hypothetical protein
MAVDSPIPNPPRLVIAFLRGPEQRTSELLAQRLYRAALDGRDLRRNHGHLPSLCRLVQAHRRRTVVLQLKDRQ